MLKTQTATAVLQRSRISLATTTTTAVPAASKMSTTEAAVRAQQAHHPAETAEELRQKPQRPPPVYFPLGYKDAAYQWWMSVTPPMAERNVLSLVPYLREAVDGITNTAAAAAAAAKPDPFGTRVWRRSMVQLSGKNRALNEVCVERVGEDAEETLVMVHGYGAGLGFFYNNLEPVTRIPGLRLYALDMLGMGNSSRPPFKIRARDKEAQVVEAENWFIDALEEWRKARKIERFTLLGHSLGGYLAVSYAIKYPGRLKKLILASPVGIPANPYAVSASMPEPEESTMESEFTQDQQTVTEPTSESAAAASATAVQKPKENGAATTNQPRRPLPGWLVWLWDANVSPFSIVRMTGPLGPRFVSGWSSRRFNHLPHDEARALHEYSFSIFRQKGSGEYALAYILAPGAYARRPVIDRIHEVGRQVIPGPDDDDSSSSISSVSISSSSSKSAVRETGIPVVFMYGENDWMDVAGGLAAEQKLKEARLKALLNGTDDDKRRENGSARVVVIPKAGHHLYLDNPDDFNRVLREEVEATMKAERQRRAAR